MDSIPTSAAQTLEEANDLIDQIEGYLPKLMDFAVNVLIAVLIFIIGSIVIKIILKIVNKFLDRTKVDVSVQHFLDNIIKMVLYVILIIVICSRVGIDTASFLAVIGSVGLAIGLALQGSLSNFAGGVLILILKPFKIGDYIKNSNSGEEGTVQKIDLFYTTLVTADNILIIVPNGTLANNIIVNSSATEKRRLDTSFGISYSSDIAKTKEVLQNMILQNEKVMKEEEVLIFVKELSREQITMEFRVWVKAEDYFNEKIAMMERVKTVLDTNQIALSSNQIEVTLKNESVSG